MAMILDTEPDTLAREIGHSGLPPTGYHFAEFYTSFLDRGFQPIYHPTMPMNNGRPIWTPNEAQRHLDSWLQLPCVVMGINQRGVGHAIAWDASSGYDPANGERINNPSGVLSISGLLIRFQS